MPADGGSWLLPAAIEAYKHREEIRGFWNRILDWLLGRKTQIAVTGVSGVGKTVLYDHLTGKALKTGYKPPLASESVEKGSLAPGGKRIVLSVIPGQEAEPRYVAIDELFGEKTPIEGVIHVAAYWYPSTRNELARQTLIREAGLTTPELYREHQLARELKDLRETCESIRSSIRQSGKPSWMLVAVTKVDLYYDRIGNAEQYYSNHGGGPFVDSLRELLSQVGSDNFRWAASPVCAWLEDF